MIATADMQQQPGDTDARPAMIRVAARCRLVARMVAGLLGLVCVIAGGCATTETQTAKAPVEIPEAFSDSGDAQLPQKWWTAFEDPALSELMDRALGENLNLATAWDRLAQAEATARRTEADLPPALNLAAGASHSRSRSPLSGAAGDRFQTAETESLSLGLAASYELDLWGRVRAASDAATLEVMATAEDLRTSAITLSAEVAATWYQLVEQRGQRSILTEQLRTNERVLELTELRFRQGQVGAADVLQQRQLVEATRGEQHRVEASLAVLEHRLAILLGQSPAERVTAEGEQLVKLPELPATGLPVDLIQRRPDTRSAYYALLAADRQVAEAVASQYPQVSLSLDASTSAEQIRDLFENWLANLAANLIAPLVDGGARRAEVDRTRAAVSERLHNFGQVILEALGEVEDALVQERRQHEYIASLEKQLVLSDEVVSRTRDSYLNGAVDYLRVLDALSSNQSLQRSVLEARRQLVEHRIDLCRALAGGWSMERPALITLQGRHSPEPGTALLDEER